MDTERAQAESARTSATSAARGVVALFSWWLRNVFQSGSLPLLAEVGVEPLDLMRGGRPVGSASPELSMELEPPSMLTSEFERRMAADGERRPVSVTPALKHSSRNN